MRKAMNTYSIIMAGGGGTRFWPLSRQSMPKQLLNLSGNNVMINETIQRSSSLIYADNTFIVTNKNQVEAMEKVLLDSIPRANILAEPAAKNTAPCLLYAVMYILENRGDGIVCVFPADHYITDESGYLKLLQRGIHAATSKNTMVTLGIEPTYPSTGYGYIKIGENCSGKENCIERFIEKPDIEKAVEYIKDGSYYWNTGIFICKASVIVELFKRFLPKMVCGFEKIRDLLWADSFKTVEAKNMLDEVYENLDNISVDYGIMERMDNALMLKGSFGWNDVGSWDAVGAVFPKDENGNSVKTGNVGHIGIDTKDCVIYGGDRLVTTIGISDIIIIDTKDALLVCDRGRAQDVKYIQDELEKKDLSGLK